jgi:hypothetical protein
MSIGSFSQFRFALSFESNADCEGNLVCKQRNAKESFSGCSGGGSDNSGECCLFVSMRDS